MSFDILISNAKILPLASGTTFIEPGFVAIKGRTIAAIGPMQDLPPDVGAAVRIDAAGSLVMPGLVNTHCHAPMTLFRGLADDLPLMTWLMEHIFPAEAKMVDPEMVFWTSKLAAAEMILAGTTTVADSYFYEGMIAQAFVECGIRSVAAQGVIDFPAPGVPDPTKNIQYARAFLHEWQGKNARITPAIFCHSPYTCSPDTLKKAKQLSRETNTHFFLHAAETAQEVEQINKQFGLTPVAHCHRLGILDEQTVLVHCVHLTEDDKKIISQTGTGVSTCPESNMKLASGVAPIPDLLDSGVPIGLGTDGCASNNDLDLFREMNTCAKLHKVVRSKPTVLPAGRLLRMATSEGAGILGLGANTGSLTPGRLADLIILNLDHPRLTPFYSADLLVYAACGADVTDVIIDGEIVMRNRRILSMDLEEVMAKVRLFSERLRA